MSILVRKIRKHLWGDMVDVVPNNLLYRWMKGHKYNSRADAITKCLVTEENQLSCWEIEDKSQIERAILALITGSKQGNIGSIDYILIPSEDLSKYGLKVKVSTDDADTAAESLKKMHRDIVGLDYEKLGKVQDLIIDSLKNGSKERKTQADLWPILRKGIQNGVVNVNNLSEDLRKRIVEKYSDMRSYFNKEISASSTTGMET